MGYAQEKVSVSRYEILILKDTIFAPTQDTVVYLTSGHKARVRKNPYKTSDTFYRKMKEKTGENKVTSRLFDLLFVNKDLASENAQTKEERASNAPFLPFEGLEIARIRIKHVDILEGSVYDTSRSASSPVARLANRFHMKTWANVIRNNLIVHEGEHINSFTLADNERILRRLRFIEDARIYVHPLTESSAELIVVVKDRLSWGFELEAMGIDAYAVSLFNRNIGGWGKYAAATWYYDPETTPTQGYDFRIGGQNINKAITNWELNHTNQASRESWGINLQKEFLSYDIKYGGGLDVRIISDSTISLDDEVMNGRYYQLGYQDFWAGRSFRLPFKEKRTALIVTARFLRHHFSVRPEVRPDSNSTYYNRHMILTEINLSSQKFIKSNYIFSFGISEDIPVGYHHALILGRDFNEFYQQNYLGFRFFWSAYITSLGYLLINHEVGAFRHGDVSEGVAKTVLNYFSPMLQMDRYKIRNFLDVTFTSGVDQKLEKMISLDGRMRDIEGKYISGNSIFSLGIESVLFTPWYFYGFRFAPFGFYSIGEVWDTRLQPAVRHGYSSLGGGIRIKNESLVFNTFEVRVSHFLSNPPDMDPTRIAFRLSAPFSFDNIFRYKPKLIPFR